MRQSSVIERHLSMGSGSQEGCWSARCAVRVLLLMLGAGAIAAAVLVTVMFSLLLLPLHLLTGGRSHTLSLRGSLAQIGSHWGGRRSWR